MQILSNSWKKPVKNFMRGFIFILFGASFSISVTKLYPIRNRGISGTAAKSRMVLFVTKANGFQLLSQSSILDFAVALDMPLRKYSRFFCLRQTDTSKYSETSQ